MKKQILIALALLTIAFSVSSQSYFGHAKVIVTKGFSMFELNWLDFGTITATAAGTVTLSPNATIITSGGVVSKGAVSPSIFSVVAMPNSSFVISLPLSCTLNSGTNQLYITDFTSNLTNSVGLADANGTASVSIAGKLTIPANFVFGSYSGGFEVVANYQ